MCSDLDCRFRCCLLSVRAFAGTIRGKAYEKNKDFEFLGFTFNRSFVCIISMRRSCCIGVDVLQGGRFFRSQAQQTRLHFSFCARVS